jgi:hypothetical protein
MFIVRSSLEKCRNGKWWKDPKTKEETRIKTIARIMGNNLHQIERMKLVDKYILNEKSTNTTSYLNE